MVTLYAATLFGFTEGREFCPEFCIRTATFRKDESSLSQLLGPLPLEIPGKHGERNIGQKKFYSL
jgi:hypothetical protein